jgi:hypothetical protein
MINENDRAIYDQLDKTAETLHIQIEEVIGSQLCKDESFNEEINNFRKDIDRRFDRVYNKLYTEFPQLKEVEPVTEN